MATLGSDSTLTACEGMNQRSFDHTWQPVLWLLPILISMTRSCPDFQGPHSLWVFSNALQLNLTLHLIRECKISSTRLMNVAASPDL
jgi:hypothetical protein